MTASAVATAGLFVRESAAQIPLTGIKVEAEIRTFASRVTLTQGFRNSEQVPIEAVYVFPLPENAAVSRLVMRVGERRIEGHVEEREKAFETYDDALGRGHGAVLVDQERPNIFTASVGNVLPGQEVVVELTWVAELPWEGEALRFVLPTTVAPRYAPAEDRTGVSPTPAERVSPPVALGVPYGIEVRVDVDAGGPIQAVESPSHKVRVELDGEHARVTLAGREATMDRDFVLRIVPQRATSPWLRLETDPHGEFAAAVAFIPRLEAVQAASEVVFLVDRSGSMEGSSIEEVRRALQLCLRSLKEGDCFNIVGFGSSFELLFESPRVYDDASLEEASRHVDHLQANLGGTEILPALRAILEQPVSGERARQVVLLTDGEVSNEQAVIGAARSHAGTTRIFTFGIGHGCSEFLVRSLARVSGGAAELILPGERIEPKVLRQLARLATPRLADVKVSWGGATVVRQAPATPPAVFSGEPLLVWAHLKTRPTGKVELGGTVSGQPMVFAVPASRVKVAPGDLLATLTARAAIRDLEEGTSAMQSRGSSQRERKQKPVEQAIRDLALEYGLLSSQTSMVAVEVREGSTDHRAPELRRVPVALTHGWGGIQAGAGASLGAVPPPPPVVMMAGTALRRPCPASTMPAASPMAFGVAGAMGNALSSLRPGAPRARLKRAPKIDSDEFMAAEPCPMGEPAAEQEVPARDALRAPSGPTLEWLVRLQRADGRWRLDAALADGLGLDLDRLSQVVTGHPELRGQGDVVATLAALLALRRRWSDREDEWRLLAGKAEAWLARELGKLAQGDLRKLLEDELSALLP